MGARYVRALDVCQGFGDCNHADQNAESVCMTPKPKIPIHRITGRAGTGKTTYLLNEIETLRDTYRVTGTSKKHSSGHIHKRRGGRFSRASDQQIQF